MVNRVQTFGWYNVWGYKKLSRMADCRVRTIPSSATNTQYPILWLLTIPIPNTNTDTGSDVIRSNKKYISTTGEYKVAFSLRPSMAVARLQSNVCERRERSKNLALKATYDRRPPMTVMKCGSSGGIRPGQHFPGAAFQCSTHWMFHATWLPVAFLYHSG